MPTPAIREIANDAHKGARRAVGLTFFGLLFLLAIFGVERWYHEVSANEAIKTLRQTASTAGRIEILRERLSRLTMYTLTTGDLRLEGAHSEAVSELGSMLKQAEASIPERLVPEFRSQVSVAVLYEIELEQRAISLMLEGQTAEARAIIYAMRYDTPISVVETAMTNFLKLVEMDLEDYLDTMETREQWITLVIAIFAIILMTLLWRQVGQALSRAEAAHMETVTDYQMLETYDSVTGLPNRSTFIASADWEVREGEGGLIAVSLSDFGYHRTRLGHECADQVLVEIAERIQAVLEEDCLVCRDQGHGFTILAPNVERNRLVQHAQSLANKISATVVVDGEDVELRPTIGIVLYPDDGTSPHDLIRRAEIACHRAETEGQPIHFFRQEMDAAVQENARIRAELKTAIPNNEIIPYMQPLISLTSGQVIGFEILARWAHPERGLVPPLNFIPVAQEAGLLQALTFSVLRQALDTVKDWPEMPILAVNISPDMLQDGFLLSRLLDQMRRTGFPTHRLEVEITEDVFMQDFSGSSQVITTLREAGIRVSLDDFGAGYSSLARLSNLPIDKIKIDRSFIQTMEDSSHSLAIVDAILGLAHSLGLATTAEGIEDETAADTLRTMKCDIGQGYFWSPPVPMDKALELFLANANKGDDVSAVA